MKAAQKKSIEPPRSNWRAKHADFINAVRAARGVSKVLAEGGPLPPPPPPSINPDYIQCPYCARRFNQSAAERHINFCKEQSQRISNRTVPSPAAKAKQDTRTQYQPPKPKVKAAAGSGSSATSPASSGTRLSVGPAAASSRGSSGPPSRAGASGPIPRGRGSYQMQPMSAVKPHSCNFDCLPPRPVYYNSGRRHSSPVRSAFTNSPMENKHRYLAASAKKKTKKGKPKLKNIYVQGVGFQESTRSSSDLSRLPHEQATYAEQQYKEKKQEYLQRFSAEKSSDRLEDMGGVRRASSETIYTMSVIRPLPRRVPKPKPSPSTTLFGSSVDSDTMVEVRCRAYPQEQNFCLSEEGIPASFCLTPRSSSRMYQGVHDMGDLLHITKAVSSAPKHCHQCGARYPLLSAKFCSQCGFRRLSVV